MAERAPEQAVKPTGRAALVLALAALVACWNPLAAPFGLLVGIATAVVSARALRRAARRRIPAAALACSVVAVIASALTLALTAGAVSAELPGEPVVKARGQGELEATLSAAGERTRAQRERAARELDALPGAPREPGRGRAAPGEPRRP